MLSGKLITLLLGCAAVIGSVKLPNWLQPCYRDDPNFNECATKSGIVAIPTLVLGDKKLRVPVLDPMAVTELRVAKDATKLGIGLIMKNITFTGNSLSQLHEYRVDFVKRRVEFENLIPLLKIISTYDISGQILFLPITGSGPSNITVENVLVSYGVDYDLERRKNGKEYMVLKNSKLDFNCTKAYIHLDNLFNGNKLLSENMNIFLNEHWMELIKEVGPAVAAALGEAVKQVFTNLVNIIPFDDIHPLRPVKQP